MHVGIASDGEVEDLEKLVQAVVTDVHARAVVLEQTVCPCLSARGALRRQS